MKADEKEEPDSQRPKLEPGSQDLTHMIKTSAIDGNFSDDQVNFLITQKEQIEALVKAISSSLEKQTPNV